MVCYLSGTIPNGKQSYRCKDCGRQFELELEQHRVSEKEWTLVERLLCERLSLQGICRVVGVSMRWLMACNRLAPYRKLQLRIKGRMARSYAEHEGVVKAILAGDSEEADRRLQAHVAIQGESLTDFIANIPSHFIKLTD